MTSPFNKRNFFNLQHDRFLTMDMGQLVPVDLMEVLPGDTFKMSNKFFSRLEAMIAPALVDIDLLVYNFYVPSRILMEDKDWESFITGGFDGNTTVVAPYMVAPEGGYKARSLADYLGLPLGVAGFKHSAFPFRAYAKIYNDWFRDENLISEVALSTADGLDETTNTTLLNKCWEKDYFTSALPWAQRGDAAEIPLGDATVFTDGDRVNMTVNGGVLPLANLGSGDGNRESNSLSLSSTPGVNSASLGNGFATIQSNSNLKATFNPVTINSLRFAFQVQRFLEKQARGGARLVETILSHFGVRVPDARLQRPELIGSSRLKYMISPIEQTSSTDTTSPQGNLAGRGTLNAGARQFTKSFVEHGYVMTLVSVMPRTIYAQGLARMWSRDSRWDYYWPVFAHLGEQEVKNKEIFTQSDSVLAEDGTPVNEGTFGFNDRAAEYRRIPSSTAALFRPGESLEFWTLVRKFADLPKLSADFVEADPSTRIFAVQDDSTNRIVMQYRADVLAYRPIPKYGNPGFIDHD
uniref:Major capsid protein n=1 Tax=Dulem virus 90 TaxID=3145801 RepID=A0AAU8B0X8_9VIRU